MSRVMLTSCGIQWLAQLAKYFSQAHLYLKGTSWLTSVLPLMMRLSDALTRPAEGAAMVCAPELEAMLDSLARADGDTFVGTSLNDVSGDAVGV